MLPTPGPICAPCQCSFCNQVLKDRGNLNFRAKRFKDAVQDYTDALLTDLAEPVAPQHADARPSLHILYGNRAAAYLGPSSFSVAGSGSTLFVSVLGSHVPTWSATLPLL